MEKRSQASGETTNLRRSKKEGSSNEFAQGGRPIMARLDEELPKITTRGRRNQHAKGGELGYEHLGYFPGRGSGLQGKLLGGKKREERQEWLSTQNPKN